MISALAFGFLPAYVAVVGHGLIHTAPMVSPHALINSPKSSFGSIFRVWHTTSRYQPSGNSPLKNGNNVRLSYNSARSGNATAIGAPFFKKLGSYVNR